MDVFNIEYQFAHYLKLMGLPIDKMPAEQTAQLKQAFYGAWGQLLLVLGGNSFDKMTEDESVERLEYMESQVSQFFEIEVLKHENL